MTESTPRLSIVACVVCLALSGCSWLPKFSTKSKPADSMVATSEERAAPATVGGARGSTLLDSSGRPIGTGHGPCVDLGYAVAAGQGGGQDCLGGQAQPIAADAAPREAAAEAVPAPAPAPAAPQAAAPAPSAPRPNGAAVATPVPPAPTAAVTELPPKPAGTEPAPASEKITLAADVLFGFGKSILTADGKAKLDELSKHVLGYDPASIERISVVGHADRLGSKKVNQRLSKQRADTVKTYLAEQGVSRERIQSQGKGSSQPVVQCKGKKKTDKLVACLQPNRRVEVQITGHKRG